MRKGHGSQPVRRPRLLMGMVTQQVRDNYGERYLLSLDEVAYRLGVSRTTLWRLVKQGELETVRIGSRTFVLTSSVHDFLRRNTSNSKE